MDHCARECAVGRGGIKALIIYPMNALAVDQARRIAALVAGMPAFAGLRVGLYIGGSTGRPGTGMVMTPAGVITDRETLRKHPPDILLTNYKMLDYLMLRPRDQPLWARNTPTTLRYVVVDELHTFDGAQGTDLALLLRRLRARVQIDKDHLICAGTSATLGSASDTAPLREFARQVFGVPFAPDSGRDREPVVGRRVPRRGDGGPHVHLARRSSRHCWSLPDTDRRKLRCALGSACCFPGWIRTTTRVSSPRRRGDGRWGSIYSGTSCS